MSTQTVTLTTDVLQTWASDPESARRNLRSIFAGLKSNEPLAEWANEALENCGEPLTCDLEFLAKNVGGQDETAAYWACKLLARSGSQANAFQSSLTALLESESAPKNLRQQAAHALASIGPLTEATREALQKTCRSQDSRLAMLSHQALGTSS